MGDINVSKKKLSGNSRNVLPLVVPVTAKKEPSPVLGLRHSTSKTLPLAIGHGDWKEAKTGI